MKLFVGNLSWDASEEELKQLFTTVGEVVSVKIIQDRNTGKSKGFGFVEMKDEAAGQAAIQTLNDSNFYGRPLRISQATEMKERRDRPPGGGGGRRFGPPRSGGFGERRGGSGGGGGGYGRRPFRQESRPFEQSESIPEEAVSEE